MRCATIALAFFASATIATAQDGYANTCDPKDIFDECRDLALRYSIGTFPFPRDEVRADALNTRALKQAKAECGAEFELSNGCDRAREKILSETGRILPSTGLDTAGAQALLELRRIAETACERQNPQACFTRATFDYDVGLLQYHSQKARQSGQDANDVTQNYFAERTAYLAKAKEAANHHIARLQPLCGAGDNNTCLQRDQVKDLSRVMSVDTPATDAVLYSSYSTACLMGNIETCVQLARSVATLGLEYEPTADHGEAPQEVATRLETECAAGNGPACFSVALLLTAFERDPQAFYSQSCQLNVAEGCEAIAWQAVVAYSDTPTPANLNTAKPLLQKACKMGRNVPCHVLEHLPSN